MNKQDLNGVRSAQDLERKYNLKDISGLKKNYETQLQALTKVENELYNFITSTTDSIIQLQGQIDGNITTWFFQGKPTLENKPASDWTDDEYILHLGDLYYDTDTGYSYRFALQEDIFLWIKITDSDVTEALQLASNAQDTADGKRRVFTDQPIPPYDVGDLWIKDKEIYICQTSKGEGNFNEDDFAIATKYTDDSNLNKFIDVTFKNTMSNLNNQIDGKISTWYYSGAPTLINEPASNWNEEDKLAHVGDLYYDKLTGYTYIFEKVENVYKWTQITDSDVTEALQLASNAKDTADGKRRVFTEQPEPPYDNRRFMDQR